MFETARNGTACCMSSLENMEASILDSRFIGITSAISCQRAQPTTVPDGAAGPAGQLQRVVAGLGH